MLKVLLIIFLVGYVLLRAGGFLFKVLFSALGNQQQSGNFNSQSYNQSSKKRAPGSNLNIDHVPENRQGKKSPDSGEYVDYEEVD
ncbi:MAG: DUF4834 family protein [Cyclobacteriaceae bacterium]